MSLVRNASFDLFPFLLCLFHNYFQDIRNFPPLHQSKFHGLCTSCTGHKSIAFWKKCLLKFYTLPQYEFIQILVGRFRAMIAQSYFIVFSKVGLIMLHYMRISSITFCQWLRRKNIGSNVPLRKYREIFS